VSKIAKKDCVTSYKDGHLPGLLMNIEKCEKGIWDGIRADEYLQILLKELTTLLQNLVTRVPELFWRELGSPVGSTQLESELNVSQSSLRNRITLGLHKRDNNCQMIQLTFCLCDVNVLLGYESLITMRG